jgi:hypothetical protein
VKAVIAAKASINVTVNLFIIVVLVHSLMVRIPEKIYSAANLYPIVIVKFVIAGLITLRNCPTACTILEN